MRASPNNSTRYIVTRLAPVLEDLHERLSGVIVERLHWHECITRYDRPATLFYLDPPYWGTESYYGKALFAKEDYSLLAEQLASLKSRFVLSLNDTPDVRSVFRRFEVVPVDVVHTVGGGKAAKNTREVIIKGGCSRSSKSV